MDQMTGESRPIGRTRQHPRRPPGRAKCPSWMAWPFFGLLAMQEGKNITTIEGLEQNGIFHSLQLAFIERDGFQCGFCTSGQIMSGVAMIEEVRAGWPSAATTDLAASFSLADLSREEIRERMSGNLCRCACYPNIVDAVTDAVARS